MIAQGIEDGNPRVEVQCMGFSVHQERDRRLARAYARRSRLPGKQGFYPDCREGGTAARQHRSSRNLQVNALACALMIRHLLDVSSAAARYVPVGRFRHHRRVPTRRPSCVCCIHADWEHTSRRSMSWDGPRQELGPPARSGFDSRIRADYE